MTHWTAKDSESFIHRMTFDFWTQIQKRMESTPLSQLELATLFKVSESAVSQTLNNSRNPTLKKLVNYAKALNLNLALVAYPNDPDRGPVNSEIFTICWEKANRPRTFGEASKLPSHNEIAYTGDSMIVPWRKGYQISKNHALTQHRDTLAMRAWGAGADLSRGAVSKLDDTASNALAVGE